MRVIAWGYGSPEPELVEISTTVHCKSIFLEVPHPRTFLIISGKPPNRWLLNYGLYSASIR